MVMRTRRWFRIGLFIAAAVVVVLAIELFSTAFVMYRVRTAIELTAVSGRAGTPIVGARVVPVWSHSQQPATDITAEVTNAEGIARFRLDLSICRGEGRISSLLFRSHLNYAYVPYEFRVEHPQFKSRVLSVGDPAASWLTPQQLPGGIDAVLVFGQVALQPLGSR
jgi:hypothetical protein